MKQLYNIGIDEDTNVNVELVDDVEQYDYKEYLILIECGMCSIIDPDELDDAFQRFVSILDEDPIPDDDRLTKLQEHFNTLKQLYTTHGGILIDWAVEYDGNIGLIYGEPVKDIMAWLNRPIED